MRLFDSHCHLDFEVFDNDREQVLSNARQQGIDKFMLLGVAASQWQNLICVSNTIKGGFYSLGMHPYFITDHKLDHLDTFHQQLTTHRNDKRL